MYFIPSNDSHQDMFHKTVNNIIRQVLRSHSSIVVDLRKSIASYKYWTNNIYISVYNFGNKYTAGSSTLVYLTHVRSRLFLSLNSHKIFNYHISINEISIDDE